MTRLLPEILVGVLLAAAFGCLGPAWAAAQTAPAPDSRRSSPAEVREPYLVSWKVAARSLLLPGWGQFRLGETNAGQAYLAGALVGAGLGLELVRFGDRDHSRRAVRGIGWGIYGVSALLSTSAAWQSAERRNRENGWELGLRAGPDGTLVVGILRSF